MALEYGYAVIRDARPLVGDLATGRLWSYHQTREAAARARLSYRSSRYYDLYVIRLTQPVGTQATHLGYEVPIGVGELL